MRSVGLILLLASPLWSTITKVQLLLNSTNCSSSSGTSCSITVSSTTAGNLGIFCVSIATNGGSRSTPSGWTSAASADSAAAPSGGAQCWYNLSLAAGITSVASTVTSNDGRQAWFAEYSSNVSSPVWVFDAASITTATGSNNAGPTLTITGTNDVVFEMISSANTLSANSCTDYAANGSRAVANCLNTTSSTSTWTDGVSTPFVGAVAIKETSGGAASTSHSRGRIM